MTRDYGPICSLCAKDWDTRLDYCPDCEKPQPLTAERLTQK